MPSQPFDSVVGRYDEDFSSRRLGRWLRARTWRRFSHCFARGDAVLDLGCGTGEDAIWLAGRGVRVTATDASRAMLDRAATKAAAAGASRLRFARLDLRCAEQLAEFGARRTGALFDGAYSNFGALNCVRRLEPVGDFLGRLIRRGGCLAAVLMGPFCVSERALDFTAGRFSSRRRDAVLAALGERDPIEVFYPGWRRLRTEFDPWFEMKSTVGLGLLLPPSDRGSLVDRFPRFFAGVNAVDRLFCRLPGASSLSDHYLAIFERR